MKEMNFLCRLSEQLKDTLGRLYLSLLPYKAGGAGQERGRSGHRCPCELDPGTLAQQRFTELTFSITLLGSKQLSVFYFVFSS